MAKHDASVKIRVEIEKSKAEINLKSLENNLKRVQKKTEELSKKRSELEKFTVKTEEYKELEKQLDNSKKELEKLVDTENKWIEQDFHDKGSSWEELYDKQASVGIKIDEILEKMQRLEDADKAFTNQVDTDKYTKVCEDLEKANDEADLIGKRIDVANQKIELAAKTGQKALDDSEKSNEKMSKLLENIKKRFEGMALSLLIFNWISKGFDAMISSMQQGFRNLAQYSKDYNKVISDMKGESATLKNSLAAAFEPIVTMIIPYITQLLSWLNTATNGIAQFWAVMTGKNVYTRAKKQVIDYATSVKEAGKAARGALAGFDEINVLEQKNENGGSGEQTGANAFEEAEIDTDKFKWVEWLKDNLDHLLWYVGAIGLGFLTWTISSEFIKILDESNSKVFGIAIATAGFLVLIKNAADALENGIDWSNLTGILVGVVTLVIGLGIAFGGVGAAAGAFGGGIALLVVGFKDILENGVNLQNALSTIAGVFLVLSTVAGTVIGSIAALTTGLVLAIVKDWNNFERTVVEPIKKWLFALFENVKEVGEGVKQTFDGIIDFFVDIFLGRWENVWDDVKKIFSNEWKAMLGVVKLIVNTIAGIINTMINGLVGVINAVINAINSIDFTVPDWIPVLGGKSISPNIPNLPDPPNISYIPHLATGGTVFQETYAKISEGNKKEVVLPLEQNTEWADLLAEKIGTGSGTTVIRFEGSLAELGRVLKPVIDAENSRVGRSLAQN